MWLCFVHNQVNARLKKPEFDCSNLEGLYDCGCGDESSNKSKTKTNTEDLGFEMIKGG